MFLLPWLLLPKKAKFNTTWYMRVCVRVRGAPSRAVISSGWLAAAAGVCPWDSAAVTYSQSTVCETLIDRKSLAKTVCEGNIIKILCTLREAIIVKNILLFGKSSKGRASCSNPNFSKNVLLLFVFRTFLLEFGLFLERGMGMGDGDEKI